MPLTPHLRRLEADAVFILREAVAEFQRPVMLYSIGKDSSVMLHLALKAFFPAKPPFPLLHVDTTWKFREMIAFRDQTAARAKTDILERFDHEDGRPYVKVNPLASWTRQRVWDYVVDKAVPYNELLDRGYKSIGCWPCTRPVADVDDERAGRWAGRGKTECGIHTFAQKRGYGDVS